MKDKVIIKIKWTMSIKVSVWDKILKVIIAVASAITRRDWRYRQVGRDGYIKPT